MVVHQLLIGQVTRLEGAFSGLEQRPALGAVGALNILLLGVRRSETPTKATRSRLRWLPDVTIESAMALHVAADRRSAAIVAIPLDARVEGPAGEMTLESAVTGTGPSAAVEAVETMSDIRMDHIVVVDWAALEALDARVGSDWATAPSAADARVLVRRQLPFLQDLAHDALHAEMRKRPWPVYQMLDTLTDGLAIDEEWSALELALTGLSLRDLRSADIAFFVADSADRDRWTAVKEDRVQAWLAHDPQQMAGAVS
jgi:hypothetical protein